MTVKVITERLHPPESVTRELERAGGRNVHGEPNFIVFWGQTRTIRRGSGLVLHGCGIPGWNLAEWKTPEEWGDPFTWDYASLGPYPYHGEYDIVLKLYTHRITKGKLEFNVMPLDGKTLHLMKLFIRLTLDHRTDSEMLKRSNMQAAQDSKEAATENRIADRLQDAVPVWRDAVSFNGQTNTHSHFQGVMEQIERNRTNVLRFMQKRPKRVSVG